MSERVETATLPSAPADESRRWLDLVRDGLSGRHHDYTQGSLHRAIALLAIPMVLELALESLFAVIDIFFEEAATITGYRRKTFPEFAQVR